MNEASKAVFLSYASQDTEAVQRICDALRSAGLEGAPRPETGLALGLQFYQ
jgi:hypothetical protein